MIHRWSYAIRRFSCQAHNLDCSCNEKTCFQSGNCCYDVLFFNRPMEPSIYIEKFLQMSTPYRNLTCRPVISNIEEGNVVQRINQQQLCNQSYQSSATKIKGSSQNYVFYIKSILPVIGIDDIVYVNSSIARCNGIYSFQWLNISAAGCVLRDKYFGFEHNSFTDKYIGCRYKVFSKVIESNSHVTSILIVLIV